MQLEEIKTAKDELMDERSTLQKILCEAEESLEMAEVEKAMLEKQKSELARTLSADMIGIKDTHNESMARMQACLDDAVSISCLQYVHSMFM